MDNSKKILFQLENFNLPLRYSDPLISWEQLTQLSKQDIKFATDFIDKFPDNEKESIWLSQSISGTGKSSMAICIVLDLIRAGKLDSVPMFVSFRILLEHMRQDRVGSFLDNRLFKKILGSSFVIFDDIGLEGVTRSVADRYMLLTEQLWLKKKRAIFTSKFLLHDFLNRGVNEVEKELLESVGSRLAGICKEYEIENIEDFRNVERK